MSMIFPQNTLSKKMRTPLLLACFALAVVGCSRNEQKDGQTGSAASSEQQPSNTPLAGSSAGAIPVVPTVTSKPSVAANNSQNSTTKPVKKQTTEEPKTDSEKNDSEKTKTDVTTIPAKKNTASDSADKKSVKKSESTTSNADTKSTKPVSHEKVPTDTNVKLTIEEKNEQY